MSATPEIVLDDEGLAELYRATLSARSDADAEHDATAADLLSNLAVAVSELYYHDFGKHISHHTKGA